MSGKNTIVRSVRPSSVFESAKNVISSAVSLNQGDLVCLKSNLLARPTSEGDGQYFLGIQRETIVSGVIPSPYNSDVTASQAVADIPGPQFGVIALLHLKPSDTLNPGDPVYLYPTLTSNRGVQAAGTKIIGTYQGPAVTGGSSDALTEIPVFVGHRFPGDTLSF
jgi:hypothetical protein